MSNKAKGSKAERELYEMFVANHFRAVRVAGSGRMDNADCDLIAGKPGKKYAIEAKSTKQGNKYISKEQMNSFIVFSEIFGLTPVIAIRFNRLGWYFLNPADLEDCGKTWGISVKGASDKGKRFSQYFMESNELIDGIGFEELDVIVDEDIEDCNEEDLNESD